MNKWRLIISKIYRFFYPIELVTMYKKMGVKIGENCKFQFETVIDYSHYWLIEIGNNVTLAPRVHVLAHDASTKTHLNYSRISIVTKSVAANSVYAGNPAKFICSLEDFLKKHKINMEVSPLFDESYTQRLNVSETKKNEMLKLLTENNNIGYVD
jgi:maltose O-acetyltransferase